MIPIGDWKPSASVYLAGSQARFCFSTAYNLTRQLSSAFQQVRSEFLDAHHLLPGNFHRSSVECGQAFYRSAVRLQNKPVCEMTRRPVGENIRERGKARIELGKKKLQVPGRPPAYQCGQSRQCLPDTCLQFPAWQQTIRGNVPRDG